MAVLVTAFVAETESFESGVSRSIQGLKRFENAATSVSSNLSALQNQINSQFKSSGGSGFTQQIKQQLAARTELENSLFEATHNSKDIALRNLSNTFTEMRNQFAGHEGMLTLINQTENAKRTQIIKDYESNFKNSLLRMRAEYVQFARSLMIVTVALSAINSLLEAANTTAEKGAAEGFRALIKSVPVIGGMIDKTSESIARMGANMHGSATTVLEYQYAVARTAKFEKDFTDILERRAKITQEINKLRLAPSQRGKQDLSQDYEKEIAIINRVQKEFIKTSGNLPDAAVARMMSGFQKMRDEAGEWKDLRFAEPFTQVEDSLRNQIKLLGMTKNQAELYKLSLEGTATPEQIERIRNLQKELSNKSSFEELQKSIFETSTAFSSEISTAGLDNYQKKIWELRTELNLLSKTSAISPEQTQNMQMFISELEKSVPKLQQIQNASKIMQGAENIQEMLNALDFEYQMMGKINEERERAIELAKFQKMVEQTYAGDLQKQVELKQQYAEKLKRNAEGLEGYAGFEEKIKRWGEDTKITWSDIGDVATHALDGMSQSLTDMIMTGKANFADLAKSIIADLIQMTIRAQIYQLIMMATGMFSAGASGGAGGGGGGGGFTDLPPVNFSLAKGGIFAAGNVIPFAAGGGIVNRKVLFPMANGNVGMMGEAGPEAIMPLTRGPGGRLGVAANGGGRTINMTINTPNADSFRRSKSQIMSEMKRHGG
jgi:lambda family phage tail tape measure protein